MFSKVIVIRVFDFVEVVLVELTDKGSKVGVFEHAWKNGGGEFIHVLDGCELFGGQEEERAHFDDKAVPERSPADDTLECPVLQHPGGHERQ